MKDRETFGAFIKQHTNEYLQNNLQLNESGTDNSASRIFGGLSFGDNEEAQKKEALTHTFLSKCIDEWLQPTIDAPSAEDSDRWYSIATGLLNRRSPDGKPTEKACTPDKTPITFFIAGDMGLDRQQFCHEFTQADFTLKDGEEAQATVKTLQQELSQKLDNCAQITMSTIKGLLPKYQGTLKTLTENGYSHKEADEIAFRLVRPFVSAINVVTNQMAREEGYNIMRTDTLTTVSVEDFKTKAQPGMEASEGGRTMCIIGALGKESDEKSRAIFDAIAKGGTDLPSMDFVVHENLKTPSVLMFRKQDKSWCVTPTGKTMGLG